MQTPQTTYPSLNDTRFEGRVDYLLNMQENLHNGLNKYNQSVQQFEAERDYFLNQLKHNKMFNELKQVCQLFDQVMYVDTYTPDFIYVDIEDQFTEAINIDEEYDIINETDIDTEVEEEKSKTADVTQCNSLSEDTIKRVIEKSIPEKDNILRSMIMGDKNYVVFKETPNGLILNDKLFRNIMNNGKTEPINKYAKQLFKLLSDKCLQKETTNNLGFKPTINETSQQIIYSWA